MTRTLPGTTTNCEAMEMAEKIAAVYFLLKDGRVMYVGQTENLVVRTWAHRSYREVDEVLFIRCAPEELTTVERHWIKHFDPPWKSQPPCGGIPPDGLSLIGKKRRGIALTDKSQMR